jgi:predicted NBD/HSP70 family sugar kinase
LETLVSEPAILALARSLAKRDKQGLLAMQLDDPGDAAIEQVFRAARAGDRATQAMLAERARYMGIALANLVNVLNPDLILLGGIFAQGQDLQQFDSGPSPTWGSGFNFAPRPSATMPGWSAGRRWPCPPSSIYNIELPYHFYKIR